MHWRATSCRAATMMGTSSRFLSGDAHILPRPRPSPPSTAASIRPGGGRGRPPRTRPPPPPRANIQLPPFLQGGTWRWETTYAVKLVLHMCTVRSRDPVGPTDIRKTTHIGWFPFTLGLMQGGHSDGNNWGLKSRQLKSRLATPACILRGCMPTRVGCLPVLVLWPAGAI